MRILAIALALLMPFALAVNCEQAEPLITLDCTDATETSLTAQGQVNSLEAGSLVRRGFVFMEGTTGTPSFNATPLVNPSFEEGDPPTGWDYVDGTGERTAEKAKVGSYAVEFTVNADSYGSVIQSNPVPPEQVSLRTMTLGAWVWSDTPDRVRIFATYWVAESRANMASPYHPGDGNWHWLTLTVRFPAGVTAWNIRAINTTPGPAITVYADGVVLVENAVLEDGTFGTGAYSLELTQLKPATSYRVRAFVADLQGVRYGNTVTCSTLP